VLFFLKNQKIPCKKKKFRLLIILGSGVIGWNLVLNTKNNLRAFILSWK